MKIDEAVKKALEINGYITGGNERIKNIMFIKPTNGPDCCIVYVSSENFKRRWQPQACDLMYDNWSVVTEENFLILSEKNKIS